MLQWLIGACGALLVAGAAYWKQSLSFSGMLAAIVMGTIYFGAGNAFWFGILLLFFISSSLLSKLHHENKAELEATYDKTGRSNHRRWHRKRKRPSKGRCRRRGSLSLRP